MLLFARISAVAALVLGTVIVSLADRKSVV